MHVQPETVEVIVEQYRCDGYVQLDTGWSCFFRWKQGKKRKRCSKRRMGRRAAIARKLGISEFAVRTIKRDANLPDILSLPLQSIAFRTEVITRVNAGTRPLSRSLAICMSNPKPWRSSSNSIAAMGR